jgi:hypothetical protein
MDLAETGLLNLSGGTVSVDTDTAFGDCRDVDVDLSIPAVVPVSSDFSAWVHSEDDPSSVIQLIVILILPLLIPMLTQVPRRTLIVILTT